MSERNEDFAGNSSAFELGDRSKPEFSFNEKAFSKEDAIILGVTALAVSLPFIATEYPDVLSATADYIYARYTEFWAGFR